MKKRNTKSFLLKSMILAGVIMFSSITNSFASDGRKSYFIKTTLDYSGFGLLYEIVTDSGQTALSEEERLGYNYDEVKYHVNISKNNTSFDKDNGAHLRINFLKDRSSPEKRAEQYEDLKGISPESLVFSFPGLKMSSGYTATSNDFARASSVAENVVTGLNQAILFMKNNSDKTVASKAGLHNTLSRLSYTSELDRIGSYDITFGGKNFRISLASEADSDKLIPVTGLRYKDYLKITLIDNEAESTSSFFPWRMEKGYHPGQALADAVGEDYSKKSKDHENDYLSWGQFILQAMLNNDIKGTSEQDYAGDVQTIIGQGLGADLTSTISSVRSLLGLSSMSELVLNMGARPANYHQGVMSKDMHTIAMTVYTINLILSLSFVGFMIIKMIHQKMLSTTNVIAKTTLMEGIKDLAFVAVMLGFFAPLFEVLLELNYLIVRTFSYSSDYMSAFTAIGIKTLSMESMAGFLVSSMFLSIDIYINFVYLVRAITVSFLFAVAPIIIVSYLWSPTQKNMVFGFFRELVGNIFMQSFHAITMTFFCAYNISNMSSIEALASAYCFVPMTQLFRQLVLGNSGGFSEKVGGKLAGSMTNSAMSLRTSAMQVKQAKEMKNAQFKYEKQIAEAKSDAEMTQAMWSGSMAMLGGLAGSVVGLGGVGASLGQSIGGLVGANVAGNEIADATQKAQGELGKVEEKHAHQNLGLGLAQLGVGLGISSFDSAGGNVIMSQGSSNLSRGAVQLGSSEARMGEGGQYMADANKAEFVGRHRANAIRGGLMDVTDSYSKHGRDNDYKYDRVLNDSDTLTQANLLQNNSKASEVMQDVKVNRVESIKQDFQGQFELQTNLKRDDLLGYEKLFSALEDFENRDNNGNNWRKTSHDTGIQGFGWNAKGQLQILFDSSSGFENNIEMQLQKSGLNGDIQRVVRK